MATGTLLATLAVLLLLAGISADCPRHPCHNGAACIITPWGSGRCSCPPCYFGLHCEHQKQGYPCPCEHGGTCRCLWDMPRNREKYACLCNPWFFGVRCEQAGPLTTTPPVPPPVCPPPCYNGGTCIHGVCHCLPMFHGPRCRILNNGNPCSSNPCLHGTCRFFWLWNKYVYVCTCYPHHPPYTQPNCALPTSYCQPNPCRRGGTCVVDTLPAGYHCDCVCFVGGTHCEAGIRSLRQPINPCERRPCRNGGTCCCTGFGYKCKCLPGFSGHDCGTFLGYCPPQCTPSSCPHRCDIAQTWKCRNWPCHHGGSCIERGGVARCLCPCLVTGDHCEHSGVGIPWSTNPCEYHWCPHGQYCCCRGLTATCAPP